MQLRWRDSLMVMGLLLWGPRQAKSSKERAADVLKQAQAIGDRGRGMYPFILQYKIAAEGDREIRPHLIRHAQGAR
jgi:hypothetical protein